MAEGERVEEAAEEEEEKSVFTLEDGLAGGKGEC